MKNFIYLSILVALMVMRCQCQANTKTSMDLKPNTTTTTEKPTITTTTTQVPITTLKPNPTPAPSQFPILEGNITNNTDSKDGYTCLRYHFTVLLKLAHLDKDNKTVYDEIYIPSNAKVDSDHCQNDTIEQFWFMWGKNDSSFLKLVFAKNEASVYLSSIVANVTLKDGKENVTFNNPSPNPNFNVDKSHSYYCANNVTIQSGQHEILISNITLQAFMEPSQKGAFSTEHNCQNEINDVVPIAVGIALTALVIIVMIAYFIGRRRSSRRMAYQSV